MEITGIILAGGKSRRMGSDKALFEIEGRSLLERAATFCLSFCSRVLISSGSADHYYPGCETIPDLMADSGPIGGIFSCLLLSKTDWNFVLSVDATFMELQLVSFLESQCSECDAVVPVHPGGLEPLIAFYHKRSLRAMKKQLDAGKFKMQDFLELIKTCYADAGHLLENFPRLFMNLNRPEDLPKELQVRYFPDLFRSGRK